MRNRALGVGYVFVGILFLLSSVFVFFNGFGFNAPDSLTLLAQISPPVKCIFSSPHSGAEINQDTDVVGEFSVSAISRSGSNPLISKIVNISIDGTFYPFEELVDDLFSSVNFSKLSNIGWPIGKHTISTTLQTSSGYCRASTNFTATGEKDPSQYPERFVYTEPRDLFSLVKDVSKMNGFSEKEFDLTSDSRTRITIPISLLFPYYGTPDLGEYTFREKVSKMQSVVERVTEIFRRSLEPYGFNQRPIDVEITNIRLVDMGPIPPIQSFDTGFGPVMYANDSSRYHGVGVTQPFIPDASLIRSGFDLYPSVPFFVVDDILNSRGDFSIYGYYFPLKNVGIISFDALEYDSARLVDENSGVHNFVFYPPEGGYIDDEDQYLIGRSTILAHEISHGLGLQHWKDFSLYTHGLDVNNMLYPSYPLYPSPFPTLVREQACRLKAYAAWDFPQFLGLPGFFVSPPEGGSNPGDRCGDAQLERDVTKYPVRLDEKCELFFWQGFNDIPLSGGSFQNKFSEEGGTYLSCLDNHDPANGCVDVVYRDDPPPVGSTCGFAYEYPHSDSVNHCYYNANFSGDARFDNFCFSTSNCGNKQIDLKTGSTREHEVCDFSVPDSWKRFGDGYDACVSETRGHQPDVNIPGCSWAIDLDGDLPPVGPDDDIEGWRRPDSSPTPKPCKCLAAITADCKIVDGCGADDELVCTQNDTCTFKCDNNTATPEDDTYTTYDCAWSP
ncbi:MAG: hypothetical protein COU07_00750 [Candidatus Harrisonbacteria bacterium CG10_big_fil_rev_8_21_14_0_10_40_38]|uniref:Uncharacterized protein n=1 Tax=Candidatus Harrisonbacteria bacterium CG10_big_fil_rev_8_21_14_0_10_40_38 TaxID=1974583 RepID=A0A2H0USM3_9BACT|nr:MAG: hypothetical protein COU07_00750 [Candidatus Harrisonbacteria bacterium CG10_big_fil_rev_8_21_14_0_10_40_38]